MIAAAPATGSGGSMPPGGMTVACVTAESKTEVNAMDYITTITDYGVVAFRDSEGRLTGEWFGQRAEELKALFPGLADAVETVQLAIAVERFLKLNAAEFLLHGGSSERSLDAARALRQIANAIQFSPAEVGEPLTRDGEAEVDIIRRAAREIDIRNGITDGSWCPRCGACTCVVCRQRCICND